MAIELEYQSQKIFIIGCHLPSTNLSYEEYRAVMEDVFDLFDQLIENGAVILCGDFNADIHHKRESSKSKLLTPNIQERNLCSLFPPGNNFTFQTKDKQFMSQLDYIFIPEYISQGVKYKEIFQDLNIMCLTIFLCYMKLISLVFCPLYPQIIQGTLRNGNMLTTTI
jgi:hypothetical protein